MSEPPICIACGATLGAVSLWRSEAEPDIAETIPPPSGQRRATALAATSSSDIGPKLVTTIASKRRSWGFAAVVAGLGAVIVVLGILVLTRPSTDTPKTIAAQPTTATKAAALPTTAVATTTETSRVTTSLDTTIPPTTPSTAAASLDSTTLATDPSTVAAPQALSVAEPATTPAPTLCIRSNIDFAALRSAPDRGAVLLVKIPPGSCDDVTLLDPATVQGSGFAWYQVRWNGNDGWTAKSNTV